MGWDITIGELEVEYNQDERYICLVAKDVEDDNAPEFGFGDISGKSNSRYPSYTQMSDFTKVTGLHELFYDSDYGLLNNKTGTNCAPINKEALEEVKQARIKWEKEHPKCKDMIPYKGSKNKEFDWIYARLIWYEFWFKWALDNCERPVIYSF